MLTAEMSRHTTFKFCLDPTVKQHEVLARHAGASRFAFNQCLGLVQTALTGRRTDQDIDVPWTAFDLINAFNRVEEDRGRRPRVHGRHRWRVRACGDRAGVA
jgi:putative transposase